MTDPELPARRPPAPDPDTMPIPRIRTSVEEPAETPAVSEGAEPLEEEHRHGEHRAEPTGEGRQRLLDTLGLRVTRGRLLAALLCALLGFGLVIQARQTQGEGLSSLRQSELVRVLDDVTGNSERLAQATRALQQQQQDLQSGSNKAEAAEQVARDRLKSLGILAGTVPATGPGIELDIADPSTKVTAAILIDVIQEMRDAGAEAMQVNGQRIVASSYFVDSSSGVDIQGVALTAPYRFTVIGDAQTLGAALEIPGGVLEVLRQQSATGTVTPSEKVVVDAVRNVPRAEYAEPAPASS